MDVEHEHAQRTWYVNKIYIFWSIFFHHSSCLRRVALLPSVCAMASDVSKSGVLKHSWRTSAFASLQEFFAKFASEIVQLQKQNLRVVVMSHHAKKHAEWQHAQDIFVRQSTSLTVEEKELLEDWQFILCDMSTLESVALLSGLQRCFQRVDSFFNEHAAVLKKIDAKNLDTALRRRAMAQYPLSTFSRLFLERYEEQLTTEQRKAMSIWKEKLCGQSAATASEQETITAKRKKAVLDIQAFFAKFAAEIVELQKENLRSAVLSSSANKYAEWMQARNFFVRHFDFLSVEDKDLLQDWELVLCDVSTLESVALLPRLQRCFERVDAFLKEYAEALKKIAARKLDTALRSRHMQQFPMSTFTRLFLERYEEQLTTEQRKAMSIWKEKLCGQSAATASEQETITAKRKKAVLDIQVFFAKFAAEIVELRKENLRSAVLSNSANKYAEWMQARNFFVRHFDFLSVEDKDLLQDWELVLCDVSTLESVALLPRLQRCFERVDAFLKEYAEALKKIAAKNLDTALRSRHMAQFPMATFARVFLERYEEQLATDNRQVLSTWQAQLCAVSAPEQEAKTEKRKKAVLDIQEFFAKFAADIVELQKKDLRSVANSFQANKHAEWMQAKNFFLRHFDFLALEEKDLLQDWQLVLCDVSTLESVALLSGLQRCFERVDAFLKEHAEALQKIAAKNLGTALRSRHMAQFPMSTFTRLFLEKFEQQLATEQVEVLSMWQAQLCAVTAAEQEAVAAKRKKAVLDIQEFFAKFAADIVELQKKDLRSVVMSFQATKHAEWKQAQNFFVRHFDFLSVEDKDLLQDWELILCDMSTLESVVLLPRLSRSFDRMKAVVVEHSDKLKLQKRMSLVDSLESSDMQCIPMCCFCALFLKRHLKRLSAGQIAEVAEWERDFCVTETELVGKFHEMLQRREADLKMLNATCVEQLFSGHLKKTDADLRFGYDFVRRSWTQLSLPEQKRVQQALQHFVVQVEQIPAKSIHEPKLFVGETVLGNQLPRPRLPKSLRQLYGNSMDAESRIMPFLHRANEVDEYMLKLKFQDCAYCKEGWFGVQTGKDKSRLPGGIESQAFQKTNFCQALETEWLEPNKPICENCLIEAKMRAKAGMPKEPFRLTSANHADPGETLPETDDLTYFEEELLSPIQHLVRIFTLYSTGQCELRGHVGNLFQNGPQFVREIPAAIGDMKMLLIRRCPKDPHRKQRVPFLVSRLRLERALDRVFKPVEEGGSMAMRPGGLTPEGYLGFVKRENLEQYSNTEEGEEPVGLQTQEVEQQIWKKMEKKLFAMWISARLSLQLASQVRFLHEPEESESDADRVQKTWDSLRKKLDDLSLEVGGPDELVTSSLVGYLVSTYLFSDGSTQHGFVSSDGPGFVSSDGPACDQKNMGHERVEQILHDELTAVQEVAAWSEHPLVAEGFWSPEDLSAQQTHDEMQDDLWNALLEAHRSDAALTANVKRHGAGRVEGLPIIDPPTVLSRNQLIREDHPYYIAAGFLKLFPLGHGDYWAHVQERADNMSPLSFWEWLKHLLLRADGRFQSHPRFYFFSLNTALRNKALRARTYFVKRQIGLNTSDAYTNEQLMNMGKSQFTKVKLLLNKP